MDSESNRNDQTVNESEDQGQASSSTGRLFYLFLLGGLAAYLLYAFDVDGLIAIAKIAVGLTLVVFVHELGHFAVAKSCDVHVEAFSIGFVLAGVGGLAKLHREPAARVPDTFTR